MTLVHPDKSSVTDYCLKKVILERLLGVIVSSVCAVIRMNLVGSIYTIHKVIIHVNEVRNLKVLKWLISECLFNLFVLFVWPLSYPGNGGRSINKCYYK